METKLAIRQRLLDQRRRLAPDQVVRKSVSVCAQLWLVPEFHSTAHIFTYVSAKDNEVDTRGVIAALFDEGREVACPCAAPDNAMVWRQIESLDDLAFGRHSIPEPDSERCEPVVPDSSTVVLVPGIAFARNGHRIGYGAGYFDRFLTGFPGISIGLAYDFQIVDAIRYEPHDRPVDIVVTESTTYRGSK